MAMRKKKIGNTTRRRMKKGDKYVVEGKIELKTNPVSRAEAVRTEKKIRSMGGTARRKKV